MKLVDLLRQGRVTKYDKGEVITDTSQEKSLWQLKSGFIKRYQITNSGFISVQSVYGPSDIFPLTYVYKALYDKQIYRGPETYYYEAMTDIELWELPLDVLKAEATKNPHLYQDLLGVAGDRFFFNIQQLENLSLASAEKRVTHQLLYMAYKWGKPVAKGVEIKVPLTQQDIADILSLTRETVSSCINKLKKTGMLKKGGRTLVIADIQKFHELAYS